MDEKYNVSFRCFFNNDYGPRYTTHYAPQFPIADIPKWFNAYRFTHPNCAAISCKVWFVDGNDCPSETQDDID